MSTQHAPLDGARVFVAGATGLAGSSVVRSLLAHSATVEIQAGHRTHGGVFLDHPRVHYVQGDACDEADCARLVAGCSMAVLTAAVSGGAQQARSEPWRQVSDNLVMDTRLLHALHGAGVTRCVYVSSATVYPECNGMITEESLDWNQDPAGAYFGVGWAKRSGEKLCQFWHHATGLEVIIARSSNIYGPYAKFDPQTANFIPALIRKAVDRMEPFEAWGSPGVTRDVIYADDFGAAIVALLAAGAIKFDIFNVGSGHAVTVGEALAAALDSAGHQPAQIDWRGEAPTTIRTRLLDCTKIQRITGWRPTVTVQDGIRRTTLWWQENRTTWTR